MIIKITSLRIPLLHCPKYTSFNFRPQTHTHTHIHTHTHTQIKILVKNCLQFFLEEDITVFP